jgi:hypothetical protein
MEMILTICYSYTICFFSIVNMFDKNVAHLLLCFLERELCFPPIV